MMLIDPNNNWKYAFNPSKVVGLRGERDYTVILLEGGSEIRVTDMAFCDLLKLINSTTESKVGGE
jgi:hypothetical protein